MEQNGKAADTTDVLFNTPSVTLADGSKVVVKKVSLRTFGPVLDFVRKVFDGLDIHGGIPMIDLLSPGPILQLISKNLEDAYGVIVLLSNVEKEKLLDLDLDDALLIALKIVEVNKRFFTEKILPQVVKLMPSTSEEAAEKAVQPTQTE